MEVLNDIIKGIGDFIKDHPVLTVAGGVYLINRADKKKKAELKAAKPKKAVATTTEANVVEIPTKSGLTGDDIKDILFVAGAGFFVYQIFKIV